MKELHISPESFAKPLIRWYNLNKRDLPWRETSDPYCIWLSEIILQQTRVNQGLPYYLRFIETFPTVSDLAAASEDQVLRLWQGLGYYSRARNLHACAKTVVNDYNGAFPETYSDLKKLKGIGDYTAAAIASIAFQEPVPVLDGNVFRVISRVFGIENDIGDTKTKGIFYEILDQLIDKKQPDHFNQGIMEYGALHCTPRNPSCETCIFQQNCVAYNTGRVASLPIKKKRIKVKTRHFHYLVLIVDRKVFLKQRSNKDIWGGLYDFFLIEENSSLEEILEQSFQAGKRSNIVHASSSKVYRHILTHQRIFATFHVLELDAPDNFSEFLVDMKGYSKNEVVNLPKPRLIDKYLNEVFFSLDLIK